MYRISQNFIISFYKGGMYISNPTDIYNRHKINIDREDAEALLCFLRPNDPLAVEDMFGPGQKGKVRNFIENAIARKILVRHEQATDICNSIFRMSEAMQAISGSRQNELAQRRGGWLLMAKKMYKDRELIRSLKGRGLEIGGDVPEISGKLGKDVKLVRLDYDENRKDSMQRDATDLSIFGNNEFDFIICSHTLEHLTNPIKALKEWDRVVKVPGYIYLIVPNKDFTNDHKRTLTSLEHLQNDFEKEIDLSDLTHAGEIVQKADWWDMQNFVPAEAPYMHMHTWSMDTLTGLLDYLGFNITDRWESPPYNMHVLLSKKGEGGLVKSEEKPQAVSVYVERWLELLGCGKDYLAWLMAYMMKSAAKALPYFLYIRIKDYYMDEKIRKGQRDG